MTLSRRNFLAASAAASVALQAKPLQSVAVQLYTLRSIINDKPLEVLSELEKIGYKEVEVIRGNMDKIWDALKQTKLKPVSLHMDTQLFTRDQDKLGPALDDAAKRGFKYVVCPYIAPQDRGGVEVIKKLAATLNKAGEQCKKSGVQLAYHNHAFEFEKAGDQTLLDVLMANTDPKLVALELDIMWVKVGGGDIVKLLEQYKGRVPLMHVKNVAAGVGPQFNERVPREAFKEVGAGVIDVAPVLKAGKKFGVKHFIVEQDQTPGNPVDSLRSSFEYLKKLDV